MSKERKIIYYKDELNEEFSTAVIKAKPIDENYDYGGKTLSWKIAHFFWYKVIAIPIAFLFLKLKYKHKIFNKKLLKEYRNSSIFLYANHTNPAADALIPTFVSLPHSAYVIVHPNNVSMPFLGRITPYLGALPLPDNLAAGKNFMEALKLHIQENNNIMIYPEAHIWPFYTKIRPFPDASFKYPVQYKTPVFCFTNIYQKRRFSKNPRMLTYIDGPFFPNESLSLKEQRKDLRDKVYNTMVERSKLNNIEIIKYIKKVD